VNSAGDWATSPTSTNVAATTDPIDSGFVLTATTPIGSTFGWTRNSITGLNNGTTYYYDFEVYIPSMQGTPQVDVREAGGGGAILDSQTYPAGASTGWVTVSGSAVAANGGLEFRIHSGWSTTITGSDQIAYFRNFRLSDSVLP